MTNDADVERSSDDVISPHGAWAALSALSDAVVLLDAEGRIDWFNEAARSLCRLAEEDLGTAWVEHLPETAKAERDVLQQLTMGSTARSVTSSRIDQFGMTVPVEVTMTPVERPGAAGLAGLAVIARDMAEHQLLQDAVAEMARRSEETQSLAKVGLWIWDEMTDNVQWTQELYRIHDLDPFDFEGDLQSHLAPVVDEERPQVEQALQEALRTGEDLELTYPIATAGGRRWIRSSVRAAREDGRITGLVGTCQDVTQQQQYAEAIEAANKELERFAGAVAHDLKTPLTVVVGMADLLRDMVGDDPTALMLLGKVQDAGTQASEMIGELIDSARQDAVRRSMAPVDLGGVLARVRTNLHSQLQDAGGRLVIGKLPVIDGSQPLLRQLFFNLVGNAIKYRHPERALVIDVKAVVGDVVVIVTVADNGLGIPVSARDDVFSEGVRVHVDGEIEGDGMGLPTCREITNQHGGTIRVQDGIDGGTAMVLTFPRTLSRDAPPIDGGQGWLASR